MIDVEIPDSVITILVLALAIAAHEIGHSIIPYYKGLNPRIKLGWIIIGVECDYNDWVPVRMLIDTRVLGVIFGIPVIVILGNAENMFFLFAFYLLMSLPDLIMIAAIKIRAYQKNAHLWHELDWK